MASILASFIYIVSKLGHNQTALFALIYILQDIQFITLSIVVAFHFTSVPCMPYEPSLHFPRYTNDCYPIQILSQKKSGNLRVNRPS